MCVYLGLEPQGEYENPFDSKRRYVRGWLLTKSMDELALSGFGRAADALTSGP